MPAFKLVTMGAWEDDEFIGTVIFGSGACSTYGQKYGLKNNEVCELVRVAMRNHQTPITRIVKIALKMLKKNFPNIRLVISFADPEHNHLGKIYQAGNWIYTGTGGTTPYFVANGKIIHTRTITKLFGPKGIRANVASVRKYFNDPTAHTHTPTAKYRYIMPLDKEIRAQIEPMAKPYPSDLPDVHPFVNTETILKRGHDV
jgi:hypothetical protein